MNISKKVFILSCCLASCSQPFAEDLPVIYEISMSDAYHNVFCRLGVLALAACIIALHVQSDRGPTKHPDFVGSSSSSTVSGDGAASEEQGVLIVKVIRGA